MPKYHVFHPDHEITGRNLYDMVHAVGGDEFYPYLQKHDLVNIDPNAWYPAQRLLDFFNDLVDRGGAMFDFVSVGMKAMERAQIPDEYKKIPLVDAVYGAASTYSMNQRGTDIGTFTAEKVNDKHVKWVFTTPHPDDVWYGVAYAYLRIFAPKGTQFKVSYDSDVLRRDLGGKITIIHLEWQ